MPPGESSSQALPQIQADVPNAAPSAPLQLATAADALPKVPVTNAERSAVSVTAYDLDLHLIPADAREDVRANLTLRNNSAAPLARIALQISGSLRWQRFSAAGPHGLQPMSFSQSPIATDTDHTGFAQEAILAPAEPLAPGATLVVSALYSGEIKQSGERMEVLGTAPDRAAQTDWDAIVPTSDAGATSLRGFGNVLWYPVAEPVAVLGDGNKLFALVAQNRLANRATTMRLRLTVEYAGEPPDGAIFDGQLKPLTQTADLDNETIAEAHGVATAAWPAAPVGFRIPSLFLTAQQPSATPDELLNVITADSFAIAPYADAAKAISPLLEAWLGERPTASLLLLDHKGQPFADHNFLAAQLAVSAQPALIAPNLVIPLTQTWLPSAHLWIGEGFPQFLDLLWTERSQGRAASLKELDATSPAVALAEPDFTANPQATGQPLTSATADVYFGLKAAFVWWQLREIVGEAPLEQAMTAYRRSATLSQTFDANPKAFEQTIERVAKIDLAWFFDDWVYRDRGLPDLTIAAVNPHPLPARPGKNAGYLVAVEVRNDGDAVADVPVTVKSDVHASSERLRIPAHSTASTRILFEDTPMTVEVNDGSVPEMRATTHIFAMPAPASAPKQ